MMTFTILLAGRARPTPRLRAELAGSRVIAADHGIRHARALELEPELWIGDFDSASVDVQHDWRGIRREAFPRDKDKTDGELAIDAALARGATRLILVGALGGPRSDHAFANLILALKLAADRIPVDLLDGDEQGAPLGREPRRFDLLAGTQFSILKFSDLDGLTIEGAKWPLDHVHVPFLSILTQSNEASGPVTVSLKSGHAVFLAQSDPAIR